MKKLFILIWLLACVPLLHAQTDLGLALQFVQICTNKGDNSTALRKLKSIERQCEVSKVWQDRYLFYNLRALNNMNCDPTSPQIIDDFRHSLEAFPENMNPTTDYLCAALWLSKKYFESQQYEECERTASHALARAINLADSCHLTSGLFSLLAQCYDLKGDTISSENMHYEAILCSMRFSNLFLSPDSAEFRNLAQSSVFQNIQFEKQRFDRQHRQYITQLCTLSDYVFQAGNTLEGILIGEKIFNLYHSHHIPYDDDCYWTFMQLLSQYATQKRIDDIEKFLPTAEKYYARFPEREIDACNLNYEIGIQLVNEGMWEEARRYLKRAYNKLTDKHPKELRDQLHELINK